MIPKVFIPEALSLEVLFLPAGEFLLEKTVLLVFSAPCMSLKLSECLLNDWITELLNKWWKKGTNDCEEKQCEEETGQLHTLPKFLLGAGCFGGTQEAKICFLSWVKHDNPPYQESCNAILWKSATQWGSVIHWKDYFRENGIKACKRCCPRQVKGNYGN